MNLRDKLHVVFPLYFVHVMNVYVVINAVLKCDDNPKSPQTCHLKHF